MSLYGDIARKIQHRIEAGEFARGQEMPREQQLATEYGVARPTINRALGILRSAGLVRTTQQGSYVNPIRPIPRIVPGRFQPDSRSAREARGAFGSEVQRLGYTPRVELTMVGPAEAPDHIAELLRLDSSEVVAVRKRRMFADDWPVQLATSYIPWSIAAGTAIVNEDTGPGGTYSRLAELGYPLSEIIEEIVPPRQPSDEEVETLQIAEEQLVYELTRVAYSDDRPVEATVHIMPTAQWILRYETPVMG